MKIFCTTCNRETQAEKLSDPDPSGARGWVNCCRACKTTYSAPPTIPAETRAAEVRERLGQLTLPGTR